MERETKKRISELRGQGLGYKRIAAELGISKASVASFCKRNAVGKDESSVAVCRECGARMAASKGHPNKRFCSPECRARYWKEHRAEIGRKAYREFACPVCGKTARVYGKPKQKYCSFRCYLKARYGGRPNG